MTNNKYIKKMALFLSKKYKNAKVKKFYARLSSLGYK